MQMGQAVKFQSIVSREDTITPAVLSELVKDLAMNYFAHTDKVPAQIIVFRDGGSEGSFENIAEVEVEAIRSTFRELNKNAVANNDEEMSREPSITFLIANNVSLGVCMVNDG